MDLSELTPGFGRESDREVREMTPLFEEFLQFLGREAQFSTATSTARFHLQLGTLRQQWIEHAFLPLQALEEQEDEAFLSVSWERLGGEAPQIWLEKCVISVLKRMQAHLLRNTLAHAWKNQLRRHQYHREWKLAPQEGRLVLQIWDYGARESAHKESSVITSDFLSGRKQGLAALKTDAESMGAALTQSWDPNERGWVTVLTLPRINFLAPCGLGPDSLQVTRAKSSDCSKLLLVQPIPSHFFETDGVEIVSRVGVYREHLPAEILQKCSESLQSHLKQVPYLPVVL
jgi:hypothetical protein